MLRKRKWFIAIVVAVTVLLVAGVAGGVALAQTGDTGNGPGKTLMARVATILGIDQQKLEDAFAQAQKEMRDEALDSYLKGLVDQGKITPAQADQYKQWWQSRPAVPPGLEGKGRMGPGGGGFRFPGGFRGGHGPAGPTVPPAPSTTG